MYNIFTVGFFLNSKQKKFCWSVVVINYKKKKKKSILKYLNETSYKKIFLVLIEKKTVKIRYERKKETFGYI